MISEQDKLAPTPIVPVAQKVQPMRQPYCEETHTVTRPLVSWRWPVPLTEAAVLSCFHAGPLPAPAPGRPSPDSWTMATASTL
eukprot:scaffold180306_cov30-Tisochrysis_lutea.AAC.2